MITKKSFFYTVLSFTSFQFRALCEDEGFIQLIPGPYEPNKPINITGIDRIHFKCDCNNGSFVNGV